MTHEERAKAISSEFLVYGDDGQERLEEAVIALCAQVEREARAADIEAIEGERVSEETGEESDRAYNQALRDAVLAVSALALK